MERNSHPIKVAKVADEGFYANSHPYKVVIVGGGGSEGRVVDELPEIGEPGYIYLVLKEESPEGNIYDEYMWVLLQDGETYGWEHIGATNEVKIEIDDELSTTSENPVQNKVITNALENIKPTTATELVLNEDNTVAYGTNDRGFNKIGYLEPGVYTIKYDFATTPSRVYLGCEAFNHPEALYPSATLQVDDGVTFVISGQKLANTRQVFVLNRASNDYQRGFYGVFGTYYRTFDTQLGYYGNSFAQTGVLTGSSIIDSLTGSTSGLTVLSARQGQVLAERIGNLSDLTTTDKTSTVAAINELAAKDSGIPTNATFWGASYDSVNNSVDGAFTVNSTYSGSPTKLDIGKYTNGATSYVRSEGSGIALGGSKVSLTSGGTKRLSIDGSNIFAWATLYMAQSSSSTSYNQIKSVADPTSAHDAATKNYTDNLVINYSAINGAAAPTTATEGKYVGQLYYDTTNEQLYFLKEIDDTVDPVEYTWETVGGGSSVNVVQATGTSTTDVMSQAATTNMIYPSGSETNKDRIAIVSGAGSGNSSAGSIAIGIAANVGGTNNGSIVIGYGAKLGSYNQRSIVLGNYAGRSSSNGQESVSIGDHAQATKYSVALGSYSASSRQYEVSVGSGASDNYTTRYIANVTDPTQAQDAATKNYVDTAVSGISVPTKTSDLTNDGADGTSTYVEATDIADVVYKGTQITTTSPNIISTPMIQDGAVTAAKLGNDVNFLSLTMSTTDIGEGAPLAANTLYGVYNA